MNRMLKIILASLLIVAGLTACKKAQDESAQAAKETITEMKAGTLDAAHEAAAKAEQAASDIAKAAEDAGVISPEAEAAKQ